MKHLTKILSIMAIVLLIASCQKEKTNSSSGGTPDKQQTSKKHRCGMDGLMQKLLQDPEYAREHAHKMEQIKKLMKTTSLSSPVTLPVAVHFRNVGNVSRSCLTPIVTQQINKLNEDFAALNGDKSKFTALSSYFPGVNMQSSKIKFEMATKNHPNGFGLSNGQPAITINATNGQTISAFQDYFNIVVVPNLGYLGESPLGGAGNGDFVLVDAAAFGLGTSCGPVGAQSPYNLGRTLVHEVGHYFLLDHIWGGGCGQDDGVGDTPSQDGPNYGVPNAGIQSCNTYDLFPNYMDYVDDQAMVMFSQGQINRMENYVSANLQNVINKGNSVLGSGTGGGGTTPVVRDYEVRLTLDDYGSETSWEIIRTSDNQKMSFGDNYPDWQMNTVEKETVQLAPGQYKLIIKDTWGDGICCHYGNGDIGLYRKSNNKKIFLANGTFGFQKTVNFTINNSGNRIGKTQADQQQYRGVKRQKPKAR